VGCGVNGICGIRIDRAFRAAFPYVLDMPKKQLGPFHLAFLIHGMLAFLCLPSWAGYLPTAETLQPYQVESPEGIWRLEVKPGNREGAGPAATTLTNLRTGEVAWKRMLPYTFWQCCVNAKGIVGGYAYTKGAMGENDATNDAGEFLIRILSVDGAPMHEETTRRHGQLPMHACEPYANRLLLDAGNDRMILLMPNGLFRTYSMRTGTLEGAFFPESKGDASGYDWPDEIRFIPDTRFMLLQSNSARGDGTEVSSTSCIQLIDEQGRTLWAVSHRETFGDDYDGPFLKFRILDPKPDTEEEADADPFAEVDPFIETEEAPEPGGPPAPHEIATFEVYLGDTGEKVAFRVLETWNAHPPIYQVVERSREKWKLPDDPGIDEELGPPVDFPEVGVRMIAGFRLERADGTPLSEIVAVALGPEETIHVLDPKGGQVHVFDRDGKFLHLCDPGSEHAIETQHYEASITVDAKGEVFARISEWRPVAEGGAVLPDPLARHYLRFSSDGVLKEETLSPPASELSGHLLAQPKFSHLIFYGFGDEVAVSRRDRYGSREATLSKRADGLWLDLIRDVACAPDGTITVRDTSIKNSSVGFVTYFPCLPSHLPAETITIYEPGGEPIRTIDFSRFAGLSEIAFDGKHFVATFPHDPPTPLVYLFTAAGDPVGAIRIKELEKQEHVSLRPFITGEGREILAVDLVSGMAFRYGMP